MTDIEKDSSGAWSAPTSATSGINNYDLEPRRRKAPKKKPETATKTQEESDVEKLKPSRGPQKRPAPPFVPKSTTKKSADMDECEDEEEDTARKIKPSRGPQKRPVAPPKPPQSRTRVGKRGDGKTAVPPQKAELDPPFRKPGYGKADMPIDITLFEQPALEKFYNDHVSFFASGEYVKGVNDAASLGNLISQLKSVTENFGKADQTISQELRDQSEELLETLTKMASESADEEPSAEDIAIETQPMMRPADSEELSDFAKSLQKSLGLAKVGARNSAQDQETIQKVHDAACELGADCGSQVDDTVDKSHEGKDMRKADTIMAEGNKRGAAVTDPSLPVESDNAEWTDDSSPQGQDKQPDPYATKKGKKRQMDMDMAAKGKKRTADMDDPEDDDDFEDDDTDDEDDSPPKAKKAKKFDSDDLAKAVAAGVKAAMSEMGHIQKGEAMTIPRVPPNLMAVGKGGELSKYVEVDLDTLKKSVAPVRGSSQAIAGDNDTARVIKAIHAGGATFRLNPNEIPS